LPRWKTTIHEANYFPGGLRERAFMPPKAQKLTRAEAAAFGATYVNFIEGRLLAALINDENEAIESWKAVGLYNHFLNTQVEFFANAIQAYRTMVLIPNDTEFTFDSMEGHIGHLLDMFSQNNLLYNVILESHLTSDLLVDKNLLVLPYFLELNRSTIELIESFKSAGGIVIGIGGTQFIKDISNICFPWSIISQMKGDIHEKDSFFKTIASFSEDINLEIINGTNTLGNITVIENTNRTIIHLINYSEYQEENVIVRANINFLKQELDKSKIKAYSPDSNKDLIRNIKIAESGLEFEIPKLDTYEIVVIN